MDGWMDDLCETLVCVQWFLTGPGKSFLHPYQPSATSFASDEVPLNDCHPTHSSAMFCCATRNWEVVAQAAFPP